MFRGKHLKLRATVLAKNQQSKITGRLEEGCKTLRKMCDLEIVT